MASLLEATKFVIVIVVSLNILNGCYEINDSRVIENRVVEYYESLYSGKEIFAKDWLSADDEKIKYIEEFGDLAPMSKERKKYAEKNGGISVINISIVEKIDANSAFISIQIKFENGLGMKKNEIWVIDNNKWKLSDKSSYLDNKDLGIWRLSK